MFAAVEGLRLAPLGSLWVAFSPLSGETVLLNDEGAAILEVIDAQPLTQFQISQQLATDSGQPVDQVESLVANCWRHLIESGLAQRIDYGFEAVDITST